MKPIRLQILPEEDRRRILKAALNVLEKGHVRIEDASILTVLARRGARVSEASGTAAIPRAIVEEALGTIGRQPVLYTVGGKALHLYGEHRYYGSLCVDPFVLDYEKGLRRPVVEDVARHARLGDALPRVDAMYKMDQACEDAPGILSDLRTLQAFVANATTAYTCAPASMESARRWVEVAEIMAGGDLRQRPILTGYVAPISPLYLDRKAVEMMRLFVERGVLLRCGPCPIAGATSPYPLAGTLALSTAEVLLQVVVSQLLREGVAMTAAIGASGMDMRSGVCLYGGPVKELLHFASLEIIEHLGLPASMGVFSTICSNYGLQNGVESAISSLSWFFRNHLLHGMGSLGNACGIGTEQILFHHDLMDMMEWMSRGIDCSEEKLALKSIQEVGPQGNFLTDESTVRWLRSGEHFQTPDFVYCQSGMDEGTLLENLHERAEQMIREHRPAVPEDRLERVRQYLHQEELRLGV